MRFQKPNVIVLYFVRNISLFRDFSFKKKEKKKKREIKNDRIEFIRLNPSFSSKSNLKTFSLKLNVVLIKFANFILSKTRLRTKFHSTFSTYFFVQLSTRVQSEIKQILAYLIQTRYSL